MKRITSIKRAIEYFEQGQTEHVVRTMDGREFASIRPPKDFHRLNVTYSNGITAIYESWRYYDYAKLLRRESKGESQFTNGHLVRILLYIDR